MSKPLFVPLVSIREALRLADRIVEIKQAQREGTATEEMEAKLLLIREHVARQHAYALGLLSLSAAQGAQS